MLFPGNNDSNSQKRLQDCVKSLHMWHDMLHNEMHESYHGGESSHIYLYRVIASISLPDMQTTSIVGHKGCYETPDDAHAVCQKLGTELLLLSTFFGGSCLCIWEAADVLSCVTRTGITNETVESCFEVLRRHLDVSFTNVLYGNCVYRRYVCMLTQDGVEDDWCWVTPALWLCQRATNMLFAAPSVTPENLLPCMVMIFITVGCDS